MMQAARRAAQTVGSRTKWLSLSGSRLASQKTQPELTAVRYKVERGPYAVIGDAHASFFNGLLGPERVITEPDECDSYNIDWLRIVKGSSRVVLKPKSTEEVSAILRYCNEQRLAVCPQSGNTGLVGGSVPVFDEVVISMRLMNQIISTDELAGVLVCEAGCVLQSLEEHLTRVGMMMPIDLGAKGSCLIGGNVSTNAGGLRLLRYGNLHGNVLGLEAVTANGNVIDCMNTLKKDNTGYHLKHLFIGSEGTLGVVTKVALQCPTLPKAINVAFLGMKNFESVLEIYRLAKSELGEILSSCELIDRISVENSKSALGLRSPLSDEHDFYVLIETAGSHLAHDEEKLETFLTKLMDGGIVDDGTVTSEPSKIKSIWELRERLAESQTKEGYLFKYDISVPLPHFYSLVPVLRERLRDYNVRFVTGFGHLGDGNVHVQVSTPDFDEEVNAKLEPFIFEYTAKLHGSISAEHGIGFKKAKYLHYSKDQSAIDLMKLMKRTMDPNGILNPYKVIC
ncbi:D-2-hydroxyglutarate dehydrogenase, mitochondrial [Nasonia vitripennis]|uniref:D-2-hydroxyglutarate dehydrogenase, mitochondrial n=1 Tax=Nasonia vitripennis TaxID=7425 RepID=A0A7M7QLT0_NASVI|nr:D-2-hydroxyglutarate dehydrogenase, mitochondrial [Nasonia vitripennis]